MTTEKTNETWRVALRTLGATGLLLCVAAVAGVWYCEWRMDRARQKAFERVDQLLDRSADRLLQVQSLATDSKVSLEDVQQRLKDWTKAEASERIASRLAIEARVDRLAAGLREGGMLLDACRDAVQHIRQTLELGAELGLAIDASVVDPLLERLVVLTGELDDAVAATETLGERLGERPQDEPNRGRLGQIAEVVAKLLATFGVVDSHIAALGTRLSDSQAAIIQFNATVRTRLLTVAVCATVFLAWMASGQLCLCRRV